MSMVAGNHHKDRELGRKLGQSVMQEISGQNVKPDFQTLKKSRFPSLPGQAVVFPMT